MNAAVLKEKGIKIGAGMASQQDWVECDPTTSIKVLSVDEERHTVEALFKTKAGYRSGKHKHSCETHVFIIEGSVVNHTIGCTFSAGDYCFQPMNDVHDEEFPEDTIAYASLRGVKDTLVEFYDDKGEVCGEYKVSDYLRDLKV